MCFHQINIMLIPDSDCSSAEACTLVTLKVSGYVISLPPGKESYSDKAINGACIQESSLVNQTLG